MSKSKTKINFSESEFSVPAMPNLLKEIVIKRQSELKKYCKKFLAYKGYVPVNKNGYLYAEGNIPLMLVAHLDTVHKEPVNEIFISTQGNITSPQGIGGDDRCGVYAIFKTLIDTELKPYVLFVEDEEIGCVGSTKFSKDLGKYDINVNFLIEIDRKGNNDAVYYDCDNPEFEKFISGYGFKTEFGSYSDIAVIAPLLKVAAVNLSSGYYNPHTTEEIININDLNNTITRVKKIVTDVADNKTQKYEYIEANYSFNTRYGWSGGWDYDWEDYNADFYCNEINSNVEYCEEIEVCHIDLAEAVIVIKSPDSDKQIFIDDFSAEAEDYFMDELGQIYLYYAQFDGLLPVKGATGYTVAGLPLQNSYNPEESFLIPLFASITPVCGEDNTEEYEPELINA